MAEEESPLEQPPLEFSPELEERIRGHKVVALPSRRGRVRDLAAGRPRHTRSLSAGRSRIRPQDLVQDIYDRMGVSYKRGQETSLLDEVVVVQPSSTYRERGRDRTAREPPAPEDQKRQPGGFQERYKAAARFSRGRSPEKKQEGEQQRRARSLSRGRLAQRWPPNRSESDPAVLKQQSQQQPLSPKREQQPLSPKRQQQQQQQQLSPRSMSQQYSYGLSPTRSFDMRPVYKITTGSSDVRERPKEYC